MMGSDEFFARVSGDLTSFLQEYGGPALQVGSVARGELTAYQFLDAVYREVLNRPVDSVGLAGWFPMAGSAASRTELVRDVQASPEATKLAVSTIYQDTLGRAPDVGGLANWAGELQQGVSKSKVLAAFLGSDEFFSRMQSSITQLNTSDPNVAAAEFISAAQLFRSRPTVIPPASPVVINHSGGDNSGFDTPAGDNTGGNVFCIDNSGNIVLPENPVPPPVTDTCPVDNLSCDNSTTTDTCSTDGSCDTGASDTTESSCDTSSTDDSSDPSSDF
jgi:hypothetical protein